MITEKDKDLISQDKSDMEWMTSTEQGRRALWKILSYCGVYKDIGGDQSSVFKQIGRRQVGLYVMGLISDADETRLFTMMQEAKNRSIQEKLDDDRNRSKDRDSRSESNRTIPDIDELGNFAGFTDGGAIF